MEIDFMDTADRSIRTHQIQVRAGGKIIERIKYDASDTEARFQATQKARRIIRRLQAGSQSEPDPDAEIEWTKLDEDDFMAEIAGYYLRVEQMGPRHWWWATNGSFARGIHYIDSGHLETETDAKAAAEKAYREHRSKTK